MMNGVELFLKRCAECGKEVYFGERSIVCDICEKRPNVPATNAAEGEHNGQ